MDVLDRLLKLHPKLIDLSLGRIERLLVRLGAPHLELPPVVHVAGTNGKGSTIATMRAIMEAAGYRVHAYTSPHLVKFNERIRLAGEIIDDERLETFLEECERVNDGEPITFFEMTTVGAFLAFARTPADVVLLETGLGGKFDATNVIPNPALSVITSISLDHQDYLGDTLDAIAGEKAGIMKEGVPCLLAHQRKKPTKVFKDRAAELNAPLLHEGRDWSVLKKGDGYLYKGLRTMMLPAPNMVGAHQVRNASMAVAAVERLSGFDVPDEAFAKGITSVEWPGRLQHLTRGPLADMLPDGWELWLDGGHNPGASETIAIQARAWRDKPLHMVMGMLETKDPVKFLKHLESRVSCLRGVSIPDNPYTRTAENVTQAAETWAIQAATADSVDAAVRSLTQNAPGPARILICGSLYLAGSVLKNNA